MTRLIFSALDDIYISSIKYSGYADYIRKVWHSKAEDEDDLDRKNMFIDRGNSSYKYHSELPGYQVGQQWKDNPHVGWVRTDKVAKYREHEGNQHSQSREAIDAISDDFRNGRGWTSPISLNYDPDKHKASVGEGNHRLKAAEETGQDYVPVKIIPGYFGEMPDSARYTAWEDKPFPRKDDSYHPSEVLPDYWIHPSSRKNNLERKSFMIKQTTEDTDPDNPPTTDSKMNTQTVQPEVPEVEGHDEVSTYAANLTYKPFLNIFGR